MAKNTDSNIFTLYLPNVFPILLLFPLILSIFRYISIYLLNMARTHNGQTITETVEQQQQQKNARHATRQLKLNVCINSKWNRAYDIYFDIYTRKKRERRHKNQPVAATVAAAKRMIVTLAGNCFINKSRYKKKSKKWAFGSIFVYVWVVVVVVAATVGRLIFWHECFFLVLCLGCCVYDKRKKDIYLSQLIVESHT